MTKSHIAAIAIVLLLAGGCGNHAFNADATSPVQETRHNVSTGPWSSHSNSKSVATSDYKDCLAELDGFPDKEEYCQQKVWDGRSGQFGPTYYGSTYPY